MDLEEFRAFLAVVETGSFLAAATNLNVARATLRRRVESLEARAGVPLLERTARGVALTDAGAVLAERGRSVMQEASALVASVREIGREPVGVLRVIAPVGLPPLALSMIFRAMRAAYPKLALQLRLFDNPLDGPLDDVDLLAYFGPHGPAGPWLTYEIYRLREHALASAEYLERRGTPTSIEELAQHDLLAWTPPGEDGRVWPLVAGGALEVEPILVSADVHLLRQFMIDGAGVAFIPDALLPDPGLSFGTVVPVLADVIGRARGLHVAVPTALAELPKLRAVLRHIRAVADQLRASSGGE